MPEGFVEVNEVLFELVVQELWQQIRQEGLPFTLGVAELNNKPLGHAMQCCNGAMAMAMPSALAMAMNEGVMMMSTAMLRPGPFLCG